MSVHGPSGKVPEADGLSHQFPTTNHPVQGILQGARHAVGVLGAGDHHGGGSVHLCTKAHHSRWTRVYIQVRIEVRKTIQHITEVNVGAWKRYAGSEPQYSGVQRCGAQTAGNRENPHVSRMTHRATPIRRGRISASREYCKSAAGYKLYARFAVDMFRSRFNCRAIQYGKTNAPEPN